MKIHFLRRPDPAPSTRASVEAQRLVRAWRIGHDEIAERVADLLFRCRLAQDGDHLGASLAELRALHEPAARAVEAIIAGEGARTSA